MPCERQETEKQAREHAWNWFALHAAQRMQSFNFFLISTAFLVAGYGSLLEKRPEAAAAVAILGAWIAFWFHRMDIRTKQLLDAAEDALKPLQKRLAEQVKVDMEMFYKVIKPTDGASKYRKAILAIELSVLGGFLIAAVYAASLAISIRIGSTAPPL